MTSILLFLLVFHIITAVIAIVLLVATFLLSVIVLRNFGRGLKEAGMYPQFFSFNQPIFIITLVARKAMQGSIRDHRRAASTHIHRMSIS